MTVPPGERQARPRDHLGAGPLARAPLDPAEREQLLRGHHPDPHSILGPHGSTIRVLRPYAHAVELTSPGLHAGNPVPLDAEGDGIFAVDLPRDDLPDDIRAECLDYLITARYADGRHTTPDGYRLAPTVPGPSLAAFAEGSCARLWEALGARPATIDGVSGIAFTVWAPHAAGVTVTGDFDHWSGRTFPMRRLEGGVWDVLVPSAQPGELYKFHIHGRDGQVHEKADPMARDTEIPPHTASRIATPPVHEWSDDEWLAARARTDWTREPISIYEVHAASWSRELAEGAATFRDLADVLVPYARARGFTHIEFLPLAGHPYGGSWGYQVTSYYAPTPRHGTADDLRYLIDTCHAAGIGVILDWVPAHFPRDEWALARFDGTTLFEHPDPQRGEHPDWGTYIFDWSKPEVRNFLISSALYWIDEFHIDGLRVDAVASMLYLDYSRPPGDWTPNELGGRENLDAVEFLRELTTSVQHHAPGCLTIAEDSTSWPGVTRSVRLGGLGFTFKWNMRWMNDVLRYHARSPEHRGYHHNEVTFSLMGSLAEHFVLPLGHDEFVHGKGTLWSRATGTANGTDSEQAATVRSLLATMWAHPGKKLLFMGQEFAQTAEWSEMRGLDWFEISTSSADSSLHRGIRLLVDDLNHLYRDVPALWRSEGTPESFAWIDAADSRNSVVSFLRASGNSLLACITNHGGTDLDHYRVGLPRPGQWDEVLNTAAREYGGSGEGNLGSTEAFPTPWHGHQACAVITIPALTSMWFTWAGPGTDA
ncbi:1,4-alpha-glucan branching protein GlgB [Lolliginicoccus levis]|uniref:1,4-alpha-glucan branching protein GlgB n=1 Tax=Lolliginicoccus levis TaxID=2919542 RepID=UPI00241F1F83|nr:1,4-alpha-glucan branching protein GlgB [Lolliginicoccus levis]